MGNNQKPSIIPINLGCKLRGLIIEACKSAFKCTIRGEGYLSNHLNLPGRQCYAVVSNNLLTKEIAIQIWLQKRNDAYTKTIIIQGTEFNPNNPDDEGIFSVILPPIAEHQLSLVISRPDMGATTFPHTPIQAAS